MRHEIRSSGERVPGPVSFWVHRLEPLLVDRRELLEASLEGAMEGRRPRMA
jgi:hypothetical protein